MVEVYINHIVTLFEVAKERLLEGSNLRPGYVDRSLHFPVLLKLNNDIIDFFQNL